MATASSASATSSPAPSSGQGSDDNYAFQSGADGGADPQGGDNLPAGFYTAETLAAYLGVALSTINSWNSSGYGPPFVKLGNLVRYTYEDVEICSALLIGSDLDPGLSLTQMIHCPQQGGGENLLQGSVAAIPQAQPDTCGGGPCSSSRRMKSRSLVITTTPASRAARKINGSLASRRPTSRTANAWMPHPCASIQPASSGGSWASSQSFIPPERDGRSPGLHRPGLLSDPRLPDPGNRPGSARCSARRHRAQGCPARGSSCHGYRACPRTGRDCG